MTYMRMPAEIAAALRALAEDLDAMEPTTFPELAVTLSIQVCSWSDTSSSERAAVVDAFAIASVGVPGVPAGMGDGSWHHSVDDSDRYRPDGLRMQILARIEPDETYESRCGEHAARPGAEYRVARIGADVAVEVGFDKATVTTYDSVKQARAAFADATNRCAAGVAA